MYMYIIGVCEHSSSAITLAQGPRFVCEYAFEDMHVRGVRAGVPVRMV